MRECSHYTAGHNGSKICDRCGAAVPIARDGAAKDDLSRILSMYGPPDHDTSSEAAEPHFGGAARSLEYVSAKVVFTLQLEDASRTAEEHPRWKLLLISDTASNNALTAGAAAQRFFAPRTA